MRRSELLRRGARGQAGLTLVELLLSMGLSMMVIVPLLVWSWFAMAEQGRSHDRMKTTAATAFLTTWFPKDVAGALEVTTVAGTDCAPAPAGTSRVVLAMRSGDDPLVRTTYVEVTRPTSEGNVTRLVRRKCMDGGSMMGQDQLGEVTPSSSTSRCIPASGPDVCRRVELTTTPAGTTDAVVVTATRRVDVDPTTGGATANRPPKARIVADQLSVPKGGTVVFSGASSTDRDGPVAAWDWEFPGSQSRSGATQSWTFARSGQFPVVLTVTDSAGATNTTFLTIEVVNRLPIALATATPTTGDLSTTFTFDASASVDPDGVIEKYKWNLGSGTTRESETPVLTHRFPAGTTLGLRNVELIVTDDDKESSSVTISLTLTGRPPTASISLTSNQVTTDPGGDPAVLGRFTNASTTIPVQLIPIANDPDVQGGRVSRWAWTVSRAGTTVFTSTDERPTFTATTALGAGVYDVTLTVTDADEQTATATRRLTIGPEPPSWGGSGRWVLTWPAVPGAQSYTVTVEETDLWCPGTVVTNHTYVVTATTVTHPGTTTCGWASRFRANVSVTVGGVTSSPSDWRQR